MYIEIWSHIFQYLSYKDKSKCRLVCRLWMTELDRTIYWDNMKLDLYPIIIKRMTHTIDWLLKRTPSSFVFEKNELISGGHGVKELLWWACALNQLNVVHWMCHNFDIYDMNMSSSFCRACFENSIDVVKFLISEYYVQLTNTLSYPANSCSLYSTFYKVCNKNYLEMAELLYTTFNIPSHIKKKHKIYSNLIRLCNKDMSLWLTNILNT